MGWIIFNSQLSVFNGKDREKRKGKSGNRRRYSLSFEKNWNFVFGFHYSPIPIPLSLLFGFHKPQTTNHGSPFSTIPLSLSFGFHYSQIPIPLSLSFPFPLPSPQPCSRFIHFIHCYPVHWFAGFFSEPAVKYVYALFFHFFKV